MKITLNSAARRSGLTMNDLKPGQMFVMDPGSWDRDKYVRVKVRGGYVVCDDWSYYRAGLDGGLAASTPVRVLGTDEVEIVND